MVPDIIAWGVPFITGGAGIVIGMKVGIARLEERFISVNYKIEEAKSKLVKQVGDERCREYRNQCQTNICHTLDKMSVKLDKIETNQVNFAVQIAKIQRDRDE